MKRSITSHSRTDGAVVVHVSSLLRSPPVIACGCSYLLLMAAALFFAGYTTRPDEWIRYQNSLPSEQELDYVLTLSDKAARSRSEFYASRSWLGFACDAACSAKYDAWQRVEAELAPLQREQDKRLREARSHLGVLSNTGVGVLRDEFWTAFNGGQRFAKQASMMDLTWMSIRSIGSDENVLSFLLELLGRFIVNAVLALIGTLVSFSWRAWAVCVMFGESLPMTLLVWAVATAAAGAFLLSLLGVVVGGTAGVAVGAVYMIGATVNRGIEDGGRRQGHERIRAHAD